MLHNGLQDTKGLGGVQGHGKVGWRLRLRRFRGGGVRLRQGLSLGKDGLWG